MSVRVFELCPMCGTPNRKSTKVNQKLHMATNHADAILPRVPAVKRQVYEDQLYVMVQELISFCDVLWTSKLLPVHLGLFIKNAFIDKGVECRSVQELLSEIEVVMASSQFVPFFFDGNGTVQFIREDNAKRAFDCIPSAAAAVTSVGTPFNNKVAKVSKSPEYAAAAVRGTKEARVYLLHAFRCLGHREVGCGDCLHTTDLSPPSRNTSAGSAAKRKRSK